MQYLARLQKITSINKNYLNKLLLGFYLLKFALLNETGGQAIVLQVLRLAQCMRCTNPTQK